jgi:hypothetical protein
VTSIVTLKRHAKIANVKSCFRLVYTKAIFALS